MTAGTLQRLRDDLVDARRALGGPLLPQRPDSERTAVRRLLGALYRTRAFQLARGGAADLVATVSGTRARDLPPRRLQVSVGEGDFRLKGAEFRRYFIELGGLEETDDVLDIGCGVGRMAYPLTGWLSGRYEGFDIVPEAIDWCRRSITPRFPNFQFRLVDLSSGNYNPRGRQSPEQYRFPYDDASFDFAFATSVFTHLQPPAVQNYLREIARVLRPGGRCLATYFLMNDDAVRAMDGYGQFGFDRGDHLLVSERVPERAVAIREEAVRRFHEDAGLPIEATHYGSWCGRERFLSLQDITISMRRTASTMAR